MQSSELWWHKAREHSGEEDEVQNFTECAADFDLIGSYIALNDGFSVWSGSVLVPGFHGSCVPLRGGIER